MIIAILNQSTLVTDADASIMAEACDFQLAHHVAPNWAMSRVPVVFYAKGATLPSNARPITILDASDQEGALGYHTEENGQIWGRVYAKPVMDNKGVMLYDPTNPSNTSVASVLSHEVIEQFIDPYCNSWSDGPELPQGSEYSFEAADPVESDSYSVAVGNPMVQVAVSNFVLPHWFDAGCTWTGHYDYMNRLTKPFTMSQNGYMIIRKGPGTEQQVFGETYPAWKMEAKKKNAFSRAARRCVKKPTQIISNISPVV